MFVNKAINNGVFVMFLLKLNYSISFPLFHRYTKKSKRCHSKIWHRQFARAYYMTMLFNLCIAIDTFFFVIKWPFVKSFTYLNDNCLGDSFFSVVKINSVILNIFHFFLVFCFDNEFLGGKTMFPCNFGAIDFIDVVTIE